MTVYNDPKPQYIKAYQLSDLIMVKKKNLNDTIKVQTNTFANLIKLTGVHPFLY